MKIFNWIQRHRFPYNAYPADVSLAEDGSSCRRWGSSASVESEEGKIEREPLLEEDVKAGDDWELDAILTIGTLSIEPLQQDSMNYYYYYGGDEEEEADLQAPYMNRGVDEVVKGCGHDEIEEVEEIMMYEKLETRFRRVTLLDLFMADQLHHQNQGPPAAGNDFAVQDDDDVGDVAMNFNKKKKMRKTKPILYGKLAAALGGRIPKPKMDLPVPPLKKLHRFMTKMMKKKIHPDLETRLHNKAHVMTLNDDPSMSINDQYYASVTESVYLLPTQGITA